MKGLIVFLSLSLSFLTSSCSHYVGTLDDPNSVGVDNQIDIYPRVLLSVFAEYEELDNRWAVTMKATSSLHGYEVEQIDGATLVVNGESRNLLYGFPFRGTPEKLYLSTSVDSLTIAYRSPRNFRSSTSFSLGQLTSVEGNPAASKTEGLVVSFAPEIRPDEVLIARVYDSANGTLRLLKTATFEDDGRSSISFSASDFAAQSTIGEELVLQISRSVVASRQVLFSDGVKFRMVMPDFSKLIPVVE
ncbi:MAG: hypothetical protein IPH85_01675 [Ignavibacteria bacterium]|nr:hypothetical protein [Ignavibacteria bacterium]MBK6419630.1 hypothetical protein [Ignavibacteria bacterium]MBK7184630.1 hypothetical protein [Ignavibacteria bacterium]MBK7413431.1 hypothetical protein [Ignavibacteria bacterium]MBK7576933.1 hypothetical protein [Ignavibacteria bacterium]